MENFRKIALPLALLIFAVTLLIIAVKLPMNPVLATSDTEVGRYQLHYERDKEIVWVDTKLGEAHRYHYRGSHWKDEGMIPSALPWQGKDK